MASQQVQSVGIYHGLPVYGSDQTGLTAIITGANGSLDCENTLLGVETIANPVTL